MYECNEVEQLQRRRHHREECERAVTRVVSNESRNAGEERGSAAPLNTQCGSTLRNGQTMRRIRRALSQSLAPWLESVRNGSVACGPWRQASLTPCLCACALPVQLRALPVHCRYAACTSERASFCCKSDTAARALGLRGAEGRGFGPPRPRGHRKPVCCSGYMAKSDE